MGKFQEVVQKNHVNAPVIFIGCGGVGSRIIAGVAKRALHDDTSNIRFVVMDTDVNDITKVDAGANIIAVQTSSTSTIERYLKNDTDAKDNWFPVTKMLDSKSVSEGAGQVRAISRLALNATVKQGKIMALYKAIDDLYLKDGGKFKQGIKVVIASTVAGGTGSGIAMEVGMLIRHYIHKNYPEASVMIRGFLVMPGCLDTVIDTRSERESIRCNGYATIKEINAFMIKGSGFFDTVPELKRYTNLHLALPTANAGVEQLSELPFDFCFLMDRADSNSSVMPSMKQYEEYASQTLYEQNIGPMSTSTSSKEDNVLKLCIRPETLGRCRFGGAGASRMIYPYEKIRDYIALNWARTAIIGSSARENLSEEEKAEMIMNSWLQYDLKYREEKKKYDENPAGSEEPTLGEVYIRAMASGIDSNSGNPFSASLWNKYLRGKVLETKSSEYGRVTENSLDRENILTERVEANSATEKVARAYVASIIQEVIDKKLDFYDSVFSESYESSQADSQQVAGRGHVNRLNAIQSVAEIAKSANSEKAAEDLANAIFGSTASASNDRLGEYMLEKFVSFNGKVMHPNAIRFMLYELSKFIDSATQTFKGGADTFAFEAKEDVHLTGDKDADGHKNAKDFDVPGLKARGKETNLSDMCRACDGAGYYGGNPYGDKCNDKLSDYAKDTIDFLINKLGYHICRVARPALDELIKAFEQFYATFEAKVPDLEKKKKDIVNSLAFKNGSYTLYLFGDRDDCSGLLDRLSALNATPTEGGSASSELYAKIFDNVRKNAKTLARKKYSSYDYTPTLDIFNDVIVPYFKKMVEETVSDINVENILQAARLEYKIKVNLQISQTTPALQEETRREIDTESAVTKHIHDLIDRCRNLASPGILKNTQDENREVSAIAYSDSMRDGGGIDVGEFLHDQKATSTVSAYELHFFRSIYNVTPLQLSHLAAPCEDDIVDQFALTSQDELDLASTGEYFRIYQEYMNTVGPDSRSSAVITPHVDQRWNSISVLPELDMDYQRKLMSKIHKAMLYGFVYNRIKMRRISDDDENQRVYVYLNNDEVKQEMKVSNKTKCDELYEVLDCLYFDRMAVSIIRDFVNEIRVKVSERGCKSTEDSDFFKALAKLTRNKVLNLPAGKGTEAISLFEIVLMYCNSLPAKNKDESEMRIMINAIVEILYAEVAVFTSNPDMILSRTAEVLMGQYKLFVDNYQKNLDTLRIGIFSDEVIESTREVLVRYFKEKDMMKYVDMVQGI